MGGWEQLVQRLWDIEQIKQVKARYWRFMDQRNWDGFAGLFTPDCRFKYGPLDKHFCIGPKEIVEFVRSWIEPGVTVHHGHAPEITILTAATAEGIWALYDYVDADASRRPAKFEGYGHYWETYARGEDGLWQIASSELTRLRVDELGTS